MSAIRRILVAIKNPASRAPVLATKAAQLAKACGAELELFHALATPVFVDMLTAQRVSTRAYESAQEKRALEGLERIAGRLRGHGVRVTTRTAWDFPASEAIVRRAAAARADLIVAGRHEGRHALAWLLGLTDWDVLRKSPVPVLLVKSAQLYRRPAVLAAIDPTHAYAKPAKLDAEILRVGGALTRSLRGTLHAMHAYLPNPYMLAAKADVAGARIAAELQAADRAARTRFEKALAGSDIPASRRHVVDAHPVDAIPGTARRTRSAIVVMGAISRSGIKRLFIGNTAERVLDRLTCDVLVVKPRRFASRVQRARRGVHYIASALPVP
ncbi:MAG TPA: universal stress protein [Steroidobacteraceae bacterium]|nr:universal stress protein [Steroidobacteraceae bacterium]